MFASFTAFVSMFFCIYISALVCFPLFFCEVCFCFCLFVALSYIYIESQRSEQKVKSFQDGRHNERQHARHVSEGLRHGGAANKVVTDMTSLVTSQLRLNVT